MAFRTMRAVLMNCPINYEDEEEVVVVRSRTDTRNTPVPPRKTVRWKNNLKTASHPPQECVGRNMSDLRKPSRIAVRTGTHLVSKPSRMVVRTGTHLVSKPSRIAVHTGTHLVSTDRQRRANNAQPLI
jgi:hypothetical protein